MRKFTINCDFGGQLSPFAIYIGNPKKGNHPLEHQSRWLLDNRGGVIPNEIMEAVTKLQDLADKNNASLEELCVYALGTESEQRELAISKGLDADEIIADDNEVAAPEEVNDDDKVSVPDIAENSKTVDMVHNQQEVNTQQGQNYEVSKEKAPVNKEEYVVVDIGNTSDLTLN